MAYSWRVTLNSVDISAKVVSFSITSNIENFCRELSLNTVDTDVYSAFSFTQFPSDTALEVFTNIGSGFVSQGQFYIERPTLEITPNATQLQGVWGRSKQAKLGAPFALKVDKIWASDTSFFSICQEMHDLVGLTWSSSYSSIGDFTIAAYSFQADGIYPIDVISRLAGYAGAIVTSSKDSHIRIVRRDFAPTSVDRAIQGIEAQRILDRPIWPDFGNRIKVSSTGGTSGYSIDILEDKLCFLGDGTGSLVVYAQVSDSDGRALDNTVVSWSIDRTDLATLAYSETSTSTRTVDEEEQKAADYLTVTVEHPPISVQSVYAKSDVDRETNLLNGGYTLDGATITFTNPLPYCDTTLLITYTCDGIASNTVYSGSTSGTATLTAKAGGTKDDIKIYVGNPCECSDEIGDDGDSEFGIDLEAIPNPICCMDSTSGTCACSMPEGCISRILVTAYEFGVMDDGRIVDFVDISNPIIGELLYTQVRLGTIKVEDVPATVVEELPSTWRCETKYFFTSPPSAKYYFPDGSYVPFIGTSIDGRDVYVNKTMAAPVELGSYIYLSGYINGAAINYFEGYGKGSATIQASVQGSREEPYTTTIDIEVKCGTSPNPTPNPNPHPWIPPSPKPKPDPDPDPNPGWCKDKSGTPIPCEMPKWCCNKNGEPGCWLEEECDEPPPSGCVTTDMSDNPDAYDSSQRFGAYGETCTCEILCEGEIEKYGTTQTYDGSSYRTLSQIATEDYGLTEGTPEHTEKMGELHDDALSLCVDECEASEACQGEVPVISGADSIPPGAGEYPYSVSGGVPPYTWSVSGNGGQGGASISSSGVLSIQKANCGSYIISATDACGVEGTFSVRSSSGKWRKDSHVCEPCYTIPGRNCTSLGYCDVTYSVTYSFFYMSYGCTDEVVSGRFKAQVCISVFYAWFNDSFIHLCNSCRNDFLGWGTTSYYTYLRQMICDSLCDTYLTDCAPCNFAFLAQCAAIVGKASVAEAYAPNGALEGVAVVDDGTLKEWVCP